MKISPGRTPEEILTNQGIREYLLYEKSGDDCTQSAYSEYDADSSTSSPYRPSPDGQDDYTEPNEKR